MTDTAYPTREGMIRKELSRQIEESLSLAYASAPSRSDAATEARFDQLLREIGNLSHRGTGA